MLSAKLVMTSKLKSDIWSHLLPRDTEEDTSEEAAFGFAKTTFRDGEPSFEIVDWLPIAPNGFEHRSAYYIELTDQTRGRVIKIAHDQNVSLVEFHSHPFQKVAEFSFSDLSGFKEFVPHVRWRLKGKPYLAVVVAPTSFDGIAWTENSHSSVALKNVVAGDEVLLATGATFRRGGDDAN